MTRFQDRSYGLRTLPEIGDNVANRARGPRGGEEWFGIMGKREEMPEQWQKK